jgi:hypothetical protein
MAAKLRLAASAFHRRVSHALRSIVRRRLLKDLVDTCLCFVVDCGVYRALIPVDTVAHVYGRVVAGEAVTGGLSMHNFHDFA